MNAPQYDPNYREPGQQQSHAHDDDTIEVFVVNAESAYARKGETRPMPLDQFVREVVGISNPNRYQIRVNQQAAPANQVLEDEDRVSIIPSKVEGAC